MGYFLVLVLGNSKEIFHNVDFLFFLQKKMAMAAQAGFGSVSSDWMEVSTAETS
jgi:hypothetical protein